MRGDYCPAATVSVELRPRDVPRLDGDLTQVSCVIFRRRLTDLLFFLVLRGVWEVVPRISARHEGRTAGRAALEEAGQGGTHLTCPLLAAPHLLCRHAPSHADTLPHTPRCQVFFRSLPLTVDLLFFICTVSIFSSSQIQVRWRPRRRW